MDVFSPQHCHVPRAHLAEWTLSTSLAPERPFADIAVTAILTAPDGTKMSHPGFYSGDGIWRIRFTPRQTGDWEIQTISEPPMPELTQEGTFTVEESTSPGFLRSTPNIGCGFSMEDRTPVIPLGDTVYNLIGFHHCGHDVRSFLQRRKEQGFNFLRVRLPVSPYHPPHGYSDWQTLRTPVWTGSEQAPNFHEFNLAWFQSVDDVMFMAEDIGIGIELIMEAWGFEFPWNHRRVFTKEWEHLYLRYLVARYDAFTSLWWWTPMNEYEFVPDGEWSWKPEADTWLIETANWIKGIAAHPHPIAAHNGPRLPPFAARFSADSAAIDTIMWQEWGTTGEHDAWLAAGIEDLTRQALHGWQGPAVLAEWGYERNPALHLNVPAHEWCDADHTRRGAWRGAFLKLGLAHGFENTWGPWCILDEDQPGVQDLLILSEFITHRIPWLEMQPAPCLLANNGDFDDGTLPRVLATDNRSVISVYLPAGGSVELDLESLPSTSWWFRPGDATTQDANSNGGVFTSPETGSAERPHDCVLVVETTALEPQMI